MKKTRNLETFSHNLYVMGEEPAFHSIKLERIDLRGDMPPQRRDHVQLLFITGGKGLININGTRFEATEGMLARLFPFHLWGMEIETGRQMEAFLCSFSLSVLMYMDVNKRLLDLGLIALENGAPILALGLEDAERVRQALEETLAELTQREEHYHTVALGNLFRVLSIFNRQAERQAEKSAPARRSLAWRVLQHLHLHFNKEETTSAATAEAFGIDARMLGYEMRSITGKGFAANLHEVRIRNACAMMHFEELSLAYIARYVGYKSLATFHRAFQSVKGCAPSAYRKGNLPQTTTGAHRDTAWSILVYLLENYAEDLKPGLVAEHFYMSVNSLEELCVKNFGEHFSRLLEQVRLSYACALLGNSRLQVSDISIAVGFNSMRTFSRRFKEETGTTPLAYRNGLTQFPSRHF